MLTILQYTKIVFKKNLNDTTYNILTFISAAQLSPKATQGSIWWGPLHTNFTSRPTWFLNNRLIFLNRDNATDKQHLHCTNSLQKKTIVKGPIYSCQC